MLICSSILRHAYLLPQPTLPSKLLDKQTRREETLLTNNPLANKRYTVPTLWKYMDWLSLSKHKHPDVMHCSFYANDEGADLMMAYYLLIYFWNEKAKFQQVKHLNCKFGEQIARNDYFMCITNSDLECIYWLYCKYTEAPQAKKN